VDAPRAGHPGFGRSQSDPVRLGGGEWRQHQSAELAAVGGAVLPVGAARRVVAAWGELVSASWLGAFDDEPARVVVAGAACRIRAGPTPLPGGLSSGRTCLLWCRVGEDGRAGAG